MGPEDLRADQATEANGTLATSAGADSQAYLEPLHALPDPSLALT